MYIRNITKNDFYELEAAVGPQNWDIIQDSLGRIWVANTSTVLMYDGSKWTAVPGTEYMLVRDFAVDNQNRIFAGGENDLGFFSITPRGRTVFRSLRDKIPENIKNIGTVRSVNTYRNGIYFQTKDYLIKYESDTFRIWKIQSDPVSMSKVNNGIIFQDDRGNVLLLNEDKLDTVYDKASQLSIRIIKAFNYGMDSYLIFTEGSGIYTISKNELTRLTTSVESILSNYKITEVKKNGQNGLKA